MLILSYENEFNLHVKEISFSYERMSTKTHFEEEAKGNSEMAYSGEIHRLNIKSLSKWPYLWRCCRCFATWVDLGGERLPALSTICLISSIAKLVFERLFALHSFVLTYSVVIVHSAEDIRLLFKLLLKF